MIRIKNNLTPRRLPNEYQEVEYIESTGTQYIDTGVAPTNKTNIKLDIEFISGESNKWIPLIAERTKVSAYSGYSAIFGIWINSNTKEIALNYADTDTAGITGTNGSGRHVYSNTENKFYLDNTLIKTSSTSSFTSTLNLYVFALNELYTGSTNIETRNCTAKLYELKIYDNSILIRDFVPCYRKLDNEVGLYDLVNNVFYTNAGTGVFLMGEAVGTADANLKPLIGNKKVLKRYIGENLVYQKNGDTFFTSCPFPTSWTEVTAGTQYKATNDYGEWNIYADDSYDSSSGVNNAFDEIVSTAHKFKNANFTNKYIEIDLPNGVLIKPLSPKIIYHYTGTCKFQGFNPNINDWEDLLTLPANSSSANKTITDEISTSNFYSKFRVKTASYSNKVPTYMCEIEITSGTLRKEN